MQVKDYHGKPVLHTFFIHSDVSRGLEFSTTRTAQSLIAAELITNLRDYGGYLMAVQSLIRQLSKLAAAGQQDPACLSAARRLLPAFFVTDHDPALLNGLCLCTTIRRWACLCTAGRARCATRALCPAGCTCAGMIEYL